MLVRLVPGGSYPAHDHAGVEELHLLNGELWIDERKLFAGDYNRAEPGTGDQRVLERDRLRLRAGHQHHGRPALTWTDAHLTAELSHLTDCGLPGIQRIPYGLHACHFYPDRERLVEALVPYFLAGLRNNERCLWVAAPPLPTQRCAPRAGGRRRRGAHRRSSSIPARCAFSISTSGTRALRGSTGSTSCAFGWRRRRRRLRRATAACASRETRASSSPSDWATFMEYERAVSEGFAGRRIVALCSYPLASRSPQEVGEVMHAHECTFDRPDANWQVVARPLR